MTTSDAPTVNLVQAMALTGVSRRTVYYWIEHGMVRTLPKESRYAGSARIVRASLPAALLFEPAEGSPVNIMRRCRHCGEMFTCRRLSQRRVCSRACSMRAYRAMRANR